MSADARSGPGRGPLRVVRLLDASRVRTGHQDHRTAANQRLGDGGETGRGSRVRLAQEAAAVGEETPGGGCLPQLRVRGGADREVVRPRRVERRRTSRAATRPRPRGRARRRGAARRTAARAGAARWRSRPRRRRTTTSGRVRPARRRTTSASSPSVTTRPTLHAAPSSTGPSQCTGRSSRIAWPRSRSYSSLSSEAVFATQLAYVATDSSVRSPRGVVVERHQRPAGVGAQQVGEDRREGGHDP